MDLSVQIVIAVIPSSLTSILAYFKAVKETNSKIEQLKMNADNEINKIKEESKKELDKIKAKSELKLKQKEEDLRNGFMEQFMGNLLQDPQKGREQFDTLVKICEKIPNNK